MGNSVIWCPIYSQQVDQFDWNITKWWCHILQVLSTKYGVCQLSHFKFKLHLMSHFVLMMVSYVFRLFVFRIIMHSSTIVDVLYFIIQVGWFYSLFVYCYQVKYNAANRRSKTKKKNSRQRQKFHQIITRRILRDLGLN